ncbi:S8 family serine peptidase [Aquimarina brevivitae]|uniref:Subtilase family protein n=1 Tax=Aquimarina brevivitae TaxID=323412 RepID=A0A4V2F7A7_9FLAO|nr:S8 family serine peptidase [Aquimarina brevivitae]RZS99159.1 subtilase family protein [Aquimarina brevivitae]
MKPHLIRVVFIFFIFTSSILNAQKTTLAKHWIPFLQKIEIDVDKPTAFKFTGWVKVERHKQDSTTEARLWARVDNKDEQPGFFDNMKNRPITNDKWQKYEIKGTLLPNASSLTIGGMAYYNGMFFFDNFQLFLKDNDGFYYPVPLKNADFEHSELLKDWKSSLIANNSKLIKNFTFSIATDAQSGRQSLKIIGKNITRPLPEEKLKSWYQKDYAEDTIPGISLDKAYREVIKTRKGQEVIVAVLDTKLDIHHEDLKDQIWINTDEIPDNGIDDDNNGYVDDINGWDFLSNTKGEFVKYQYVESTRIVKAYDSIFKDKAANEIPSDLMDKYELYTKAYTAWKKEVDPEAEVKIHNMKLWKDKVNKGERVLDSIYPKMSYTSKELDSLIVSYKDNLAIQPKLKDYKEAWQNNLTQEALDEMINSLHTKQKIILNLAHNERAIPGDDVTNINDRYYGSPIVYGDVPYQHATFVSGVMGATRSNSIGINGFSVHIKLMPVVMVASGDEHDKDVALAIRYAVDNGAKVINMSWGKNLSLNQQWVNEALQYAADKDVLLVTAAGNEDTNIDKYDYYLNDHEEGKEIVDNLIVVGASTWDKENLKAQFSNYGINNVDVFAPGVDVFTTTYSKNQYGFGYGTSVSSPLVAGLAGLLRAYYPKLSAKQVKQIILASGTHYDTTILMASENGEVYQVPFSKLSKSGKVVNAYNAFLMAEKLSKN